MSVESIIENELRLDDDGVWVRPNARTFAYTDGRRSEIYLKTVLQSADDLSSRSAELAAHIRDWPSEYHLTPKRSQLLRGFDFNRSSRVLEVGCGCGAITRFLGETFDSVVSIEGSRVRAHLARLRTRDLDNVSIVTSPFEEIRFKGEFDLVFCIGVFEYASMFVEAEDPHEKILEYFDGLLAPGGVLVLAIENKFGLKYFSSSAEDHTSVMFDGIEGYPRFRTKAKTFGKEELTKKLSKRFSTIDFYFPLPDYKIPSCVISQSLIDTVDVSDLIGSFPSMDYSNRGRRPLFSEALAWREIAANRLVPAMAHSFLVFAGKSDRTNPPLEALGLLYSNDRRPVYRTKTRIETGESGGVRAIKTRCFGGKNHVEKNLEHRETSNEWLPGASLHVEMLRRARARDLSIAEIFEPTRPWFDDLIAASHKCGSGQVPGDRLDTIWRNCFLVDGRCHYIDQEWVWTEPLPLAVAVARGLYYFGQGLRGGPGLNPELARMRVGQMMRFAAAKFGIGLDSACLDELTEFEAAFLDQVTGRNAGRAGKNDVRKVLRCRIDPGNVSRPDSLHRRGARWLRRRLGGSDRGYA